VLWQDDHQGIVLTIYTKPLARLVEAFQALPGIGPKSAQRLAFHVLKWNEAQVEQFAHALVEAKATIHPCPICYNISAQTPCEICTSPKRDRTTLCVVPEAKDLFALEKTGEFKGLYHVLQGLISPMDGIGPGQLRLAELSQRVTDSKGEIVEVILALPPSVEGDTTSLYLSRTLASDGARLTRIAFGLPVGGDIEYADALTLMRALSGRVAV
jgi:recombination protein RecR